MVKHIQEKKKILGYEQYLQKQINKLLVTAVENRGMTWLPTKNM